MHLLVLTALVLLAALVAERLRLDRARESVPLRIAVTGTRGKTTVTRLLASVLREDGRRVLAKTTGSEPGLILPDGTVEEIRRRGPPSILEQKKLLHRAARLGAEVVVAEVMSIHPESHRVEGQALLVPHLVLVTNFRVDHTGAAGDTRAGVAAVLARGVPDGARVLLPGSEDGSAFRARIEDGGCTVTAVAAGSADGLLDDGPTPLTTFADNVELVVAAARSLGVDDAVIRRGVAGARHDPGAARLWRLRTAEREPPVWAVSAFAANDPESTALLHDRALAAVGGAAAGGAVGPCVGLLSLRADRGDRTLQWADALAAGFLDRFHQLYVTGVHANALARRVRRRRLARRVPARGPGNGAAAGVSVVAGAGTPEAGTPVIRAVPSAGAEALTALALEPLRESGGVLFGFGNMGGRGRELAAHWARTGEEVGRGP